MSYVNVPIPNLRVTVPKAIAPNDKWVYAFLKDVSPGTRRVDVYKVCVMNDGTEIKAYFYTKSWDVKRDGLIYNNPTWLRDFRKAVKQNVQYSEQGLQGKNYVHLDIVQ